MPGLCMWRLHWNQSYWFLVFSSKSRLLNVTGQYHIYLFVLLASFCCCSLKKVAHFLQDNCGVTEGRHHGTGALALSLIIICFGFEYQLNACKVKIQKTVQRACPEQGQTNRWVKALKRTEIVCFFPFSVFCPVSVMFSLHQNPPAIVQQQAASLHVWLLFKSHCFYHLPTPSTGLAG